MRVIKYNLRAMEFEKRFGQNLGHDYVQCHLIHIGSAERLKCKYGKVI
jgi:hypothetical protein